MKNLFFILAAIVIFFVFIKGSLIKKVDQAPTPSEPIACTMDAKMCPDGSYVGRVGPSCEFEKCPDYTPATPVKIGQNVTINGVSITPTKLVEDSRCPTDVQCIQAGTIKVEVSLELGAKKEKQTIELFNPATFESKTISLTEVSPEEKNSKVTVKPEDYLFTFSVSQ